MYVLYAFVWMHIASCWEFPKHIISYPHLHFVIYRSNVLMSRRTEEVPYHLKRAERKQESEMVLLDIDLLILMHYR